MPGQDSRLPPADLPPVVRGTISSSLPATGPGMPDPLPPLEIRRCDPRRQYRQRIAFALLWLASLGIAAAVAWNLAGRPPEAAMRSELRASEARSEGLRQQLAQANRAEQVTRAALAEVQQDLREREEEINALRADLAFYERLVGSDRRSGLAVHSLSLAPTGDPRAWTFSLTLTQNIKRGAETRGRLRLAVEGLADGELTRLDWPALTGTTERPPIEYRFRYFQEVGGTIVLPPGFQPARVLVHAEGEGDRVEQEFAWNDALRSERAPEPATLPDNEE